MEQVSKEEMKRIQLMNQFIGLNPTGQIELTENGTFKTLGNPARVVSPMMLQTQSLEKASTNTPIDTQSQVTVKEGFEVMNPKMDDSKVRYMVYVLGFIILVLFLLMNLKKM